MKPLKYARTMRLKGRTIILPDLPPAPREPPREPQGVPGLHLKGERRQRHSLWRSGVRACYRCGGSLNGPDECTLEHKLALAEGGENTLASGNLSLSHHGCNTRHGGEVAARLELAEWAALSWHEKARFWWQRSPYVVARKLRAFYYRTRYRILRRMGWSNDRINGREARRPASLATNYEDRGRLPVSTW